MTAIQEFAQNYGTKGLGLLIERFITDAPDFPGANELAKEIGKAIGDLEFALREVHDTIPVDSEGRLKPKKPDALERTKQAFDNVDRLLAEKQEYDNDPTDIATKPEFKYDHAWAMRHGF